MSMLSNSHYGGRRAQATSRLVAPAVLFSCKEWYSGRYEPAEAPKCELLVNAHPEVSGIYN